MQIHNSVKDILGYGFDEILDDGWVNISRFSNDSNFGDLAKNFTLVAMPNSGLLPGSFLYDVTSIQISTKNYSPLDSPFYFKFENWYKLKETYFNLIHNSKDPVVCLFHNKLIFAPGIISEYPDIEAVVRLFSSIIKLNEEICKSKNILLMEWLGIDYNNLSIDMLKKELDHLFPNSITENIYLF